MLPYRGVLSMNWIGVILIYLGYCVDFNELGRTMLFYAVSCNTIKDVLEFKKKGFLNQCPSVKIQL